MLCWFWSSFIAWSASRIFKEEVTKHIVRQIQVQPHNQGMRRSPLQKCTRERRRSWKMTEVWWVDRWFDPILGSGQTDCCLHSLLRIPLPSSSSSHHRTEDSNVYFLYRMVGEKNAQGTWTWEALPTAYHHCELKCHRASRSLVTNTGYWHSVNSNAELSNFISMIIYLHCTDTNEKHPQVHSTIQYIYFKNIILYKRFIEHWHVHVTNSQSLSPILW